MCSTIWNMVYYNCSIHLLFIVEERNLLHLLFLAHCSNLKRKKKVKTWNGKLTTYLDVLRHRYIYFLLRTLVRLIHTGWLNRSPVRFLPHLVLVHYSGECVSCNVDTTVADDTFCPRVPAFRFIIPCKGKKDLFVQKLELWRAFHYLVSRS